MTSPCVDPKHLAVVDGALTPQPWMQLRQIATASTPTRAGTYSPSGGGTKNDLLQTLQLAWTNDSPLPQKVYGLVTRGESRMVITARSRAVLSTSHGFALGAAAPALVEESQFGVGINRGQSSALFSNAAAFAVVENRQGARTTLLRPTLVGDMVVPSGGVVTARFALSFKSLFWESSAIEGGDAGTECSYITGETRLDLFAYPSL